MLELLTDYQVWASLVTLTALEIVLGIDNLIFLSIVSGRLPRDQQPAARRIGLALALLGRVALLFSLTWLIGLTAPILTLAGFDLSWRDVVLIVGGAFLIVKGTMETHHMLEGQEEGARIGTVTFFSAIVQITLLDIVFALDRSSPRVVDDAAPPGDGYGCGDRHDHHVGGADPVGNFVNKHPTVKMLALSFLLLVGVALIADGMHFHILAWSTSTSPSPSPPASKR